MKKANLVSLLWRVPIAVLVTAAIAMAFMRFAGGAAMFCIDPPAGDPGWEWKVPLAWTIIYGVSAFIGILIASFRPNTFLIPIVVFVVAVAMFVVARYLPYSPVQRQYFQQEAIYGISSLIVAGILACTVVLLTKKETTERDGPANSGSAGVSPE